MHATDVRVALWHGAAPADVAIADDFDAIVSSARLAATVHRSLAAGGFILAALRERTLIGYATTVPVAAVSSPEAAPLDRWHDLPHALELGALEVARSSRRRGVGSALMRAFAEWHDLERWIVLAHGIASHWDVGGAQLEFAQYRTMLVRLLSRAGFALRHTDDPDVREDPFSFLAARIGADAPPSARAAFAERLFSRPRPRR